MAQEKLAQIARAGAVTRFYMATVTAVARNPNTLTADPHDGSTVDQVPWVGTLPLVGDEVVLLLSEGQLIAISAGRPT